MQSRSESAELSGVQHEHEHAPDGVKRQPAAVYEVTNAKTVCSRGLLPPGMPAPASSTFRSAALQ